MESNINNKVERNTMKRISIIFMAFLFMITGAFASVIYNDDQLTAVENYNSGSVISSSSPALAFNSMSDVTYNFKLTNEPMYLVLSAGSGNTNENITITYYDSILEDFISNNYVIPDDTFIIQLTPQNTGDETTLILSNATGNIFYSYVFMNDNERGAGNENSIFAPLISAVVDLIEINVSIWVVLYYVFIMTLVLGTIGGVVLLGKRYYDWAEQHNIYKHRNTRK